MKTTTTTTTTTTTAGNFRVQYSSCTHTAVARGNVCYVSFHGTQSSCTMFSFPCSADHERDWPPCKVVFFGLATNTLNVRNNDFSFNNSNMYHKKCYVYFHSAQGVLRSHRKQTQNSPNQRAHRVFCGVMSQANIQATSDVECNLWYGVRRPCFPVLHRF